MHGRDLDLGAHGILCKCIADQILLIFGSAVWLCLGAENLLDMDDSIDL